MADKIFSKKELYARIEQIIRDYEGQCNDLEDAIGALMFGFFVGWKPLFLMHDKKRIKRMERILGLEFREVLPEEGSLAHKSLAWTMLQRLKASFWNAVNGRGEKGTRDAKIVAAA